METSSAVYVSTVVDMISLRRPKARLGLNNEMAVFHLSKTEIIMCNVYQRLAYTMDDGK